MSDYGTAWMIAGGLRSETIEDQRQLRHRIALAESRPSLADNLVGLRARIAAIVGGRPLAVTSSGTMSTDCCAA